MRFLVNLVELPSSLTPSLIPIRRFHGTQRPGFGPGERHAGEMRLDAAVDIARSRIGRLGKGASVVKHGGGFSEGQFSGDTDEPGREG